MPKQRRPRDPFEPVLGKRRGDPANVAGAGRSSEDEGKDAGQSRAPENGPQTTDVPAAEDLPRRIRESAKSIRQLAREAETTDSHISEAMRGVRYRKWTPELIERLSISLALPADFYPEVRAKRLHDAALADPDLLARAYRLLE